MSYQVLARKWRPRRFAELVGQEHVVRALMHSLDSGRMHHAYLFTGTRGVGKTTIARIFAKSLNCAKGVSAEPCGECAVCRSVDEGRFIDLLEIDAASNTGVDDVRELIENAQYAPTSGRYKVYLIDEVHMLSRSAFNALLKILEEPPEHAKFLLATTDPQKLPMTVLSRCLQFSLKRLQPEQIVAQMQHILQAEQIKFDDEALIELTRGADGSLRDGLSLLDQAIAYGNGSVLAEDVRAMLGTIARSEVFGLLKALAEGNGQALLQEARQIESFTPDFGAVLDDLAVALHRIQLRQLVPELDQDAAEVVSLADRLDAVEVQMYYQLALRGRNELAIAPDVTTGFEMALLRMLAFRPDQGTTHIADKPRTSVAPENIHKPPVTTTSPLGSTATESPVVIAPPPGQKTQPLAGKISVAGSEVATQLSAPSAVGVHPGLPDDADAWERIVKQADLCGAVGQLAQQAVLRGREGSTLILALAPKHMALAISPLDTQLEQHLSKLFGKPVRVHCVAEDASEAPAARAERASQIQQKVAADALQNDPLVQDMQKRLGASVIPKSIRPLET